MFRLKYKSGFSFVDFIIGFLVLGFASTIALNVVANYQKETKNNVITSQTIKEYAYNTLWDGEFQKLNQATNMILVSNSNTLENLCSGNLQNKCMMEQYFKVLSAMNSCPDNVKGRCWHNDGEWFLSNRTPSTENIDLASGLILNNGVFVLFNNVDTSCTNRICGQIYVDVNGFNKPNRIGNDIFKINILKNSIVKENM